MTINKQSAISVGLVIVLIVAAFGAGSYKEKVDDNYSDVAELKIHERLNISRIRDVEEAITLLTQLVDRHESEIRKLQESN